MSFNAVAVAQSFAEEINRRAPAMESVRRLPADLARKFADAGLFRMVLPAALGGQDTPPAQIALALETLAQADASAAWCVMIGATMGAMANRLPAGAAREVFEKGGIGDDLPTVTLDIELRQMGPRVLIVFRNSGMWPAAARDAGPS